MLAGNFDSFIWEDRFDTTAIEFKGSEPKNCM